MTLLILGVLIWSGAHFFKRMAPDRRAAMGDSGKGLVAAVIGIGLVAMIFGYRWAPFVPVYDPPGWGVHLNNLLMIAAVVLFGMSATTGRLRGRMRHPMLTGVKVWAVAHLFVNGDLASLILFGGLLAWAVAEVVVINRSSDWDRPEPGGVKGDIRLAVISTIVFIVITAIHAWLGVWPFPG